MAYHDQAAADENVMRTSLRGQLVVLNFEYNDIGCLDKEVNKVISAFKERGFKNHRVHIPMKEPSSTLEKELSEFLPSEHSDNLLVVYYNGHGGLEEGDGLVLASHNHPTKTRILQRDAAAFWKALDLLAKDPGKISQREIPEELQISKYDKTTDSDPGESTWLQNLVKRRDIYQPIAEVNWSNIHRRIMAAKCDVAIILDCCDSGAAAISGNQTEEAVNETFRQGLKQLPTDEEQQYAKEILAACSWSSKSRGEINDALVKVLNHEKFQEGMSLETLHDEIQGDLGEIRLTGSEVAQPTRIRLHRSNVRRKVRLPPRLRKS